MTILRGIATIAIFALLLSAFASIPAMAADAKAPVLSIGTVDVEKAFDGYTKKDKLQQELMANYERLKADLELRGTNKLLTEDEFKQLADLKAKPTLDDASKKKVDELLALSKQREQEFQALQQKANATDQEKAQLKALQDQLTKTDETLKSQEAQYNDELTKQRIDLSKQVMQDVDTAVAVIAKEKGLTIVFNKSAAGDPGFIVFSSVDITDEVIKKLNKK